MMNTMLKFAMLLVSLCICILSDAPGMEAGERVQWSQQLMSERPAGDIRAVMYMTPW